MDDAFTCRETLSLHASIVGKRARSGLLSAPSVQVERDALNADEGAGGRRLFVPGRMSYVRDENSVFIDRIATGNKEEEIQNECR
jgi:hypothetical protein